MKKTLQKWLPALLTAVMALWFLSKLPTHKNKTFDYDKFAQLPTMDHGRITPLDSVARNALLEIHEKQTLDLKPWEGWSQHPKTISAIQWLANVMMNPKVADTWPVFRINNPDLVSLLKLPTRNLAKGSDGMDYSWNQIKPSLDILDHESKRVQGIASAKRNAYERAIANLHGQLIVYAQLKNAVEPAGTHNWPTKLAAFEKLIPAGIAAAEAEQAGQPFNHTNFEAFIGYIQQFQFMANMQPPMILPPDHTTHWRRMGEALLDAPRGKAVDQYIHDYANMAGALDANQPKKFNAALNSLYAHLSPTQAGAVAHARAETFFNHMQPFYNAMIIYILAGLLAIFSWFNLSETLRRSSVWLIWLAFTIHTAGLVFRMVLEGRPPVTNLYSSAIFCGWGAVLLGIILENIYKNGIGTVVASGVGFITLIIAQHLAMEGDTMEMMRAVLNSNFWLATHVVTVTIGYASTYVAGFLALIYILRGLFTKTLDEATGKSLGRMIYGIVCFATLFSFIGTVLGGIWADQSWGRFWGWDPKENGALIIVLWNALILHLRWAGLIRERGLANCAIFGNIVTAWSWFGVNMLGIGLHSYGFTQAAFKWLIIFDLSQVVIIGLGLIPKKFWRSFRTRPA